MASGFIYAVGLLIVVLATYWRGLYHFLKTRWYFSKIPGIGKPAMPLFGHSYLFAGSAVHAFKTGNSIRFDLINKYNQKIAATWLGPFPVLQVFHPDAREVILRSNKHIEKSLIYDFLHCWLGTGLLTSKGKKWLQRRKLITPSFHFTILEDFLETMNEQSITLIEKIQKMKKNNETVNVLKCVTACTLDIICETAMGKPVNAQVQEDSEYVQAVNGVSYLVLKRINSVWLWPDFIFNRTQMGIRQKKYLNTLHEFTRSVIRDRSSKHVDESSKSRRLAFLDVLLHAETEDGEKLPLSGIQEEVDTFMFEGHDTTSAAIIWALYLLGRHPEIQRKVQKEIDDVIGNKIAFNFSMDDLRQLEYLEQVIKESLRLYPSVHLLGRVTSEDCEIDGYKVIKGTQTVIFIHTLHRNPNVWENPDKFDPERFTKANSLNRHPYTYIPFSAGPRNCIGQKFALMEEKVILSRILHHYDVTSTTDVKDLELAGELILRSTNSLNLSIAERK